MSKYDLAVVGTGLGGLVAAAMCSRRKQKVILLTEDDAVGGALRGFKKDGFLFRSGPALSFGFERAGALQEFYSSLGISHTATVNSPCYQVAMSDRRITVFAEKSATLEELRREFPRDYDEISRFYADLERKAIKNTKSSLSSYVSRRRTAGAYVRKYRFSGEWHAFLDVQSWFFFHTPVSDLPLSTLILLCDAVPLYLHGGFKKLADQLLDVIIQNGGEVRFTQAHVELLVRNGKVDGVVTPSGAVEADAVLLNTRQDRARACRVTTFGIRDDVVPVGMCQEVICLPDHSRPSSFFTLSLSMPDDAAAPAHARALTATFFGDWQDYGPVNQVARIIPFLEDFCLFAERAEGSSEAMATPGVSFQPVKSPTGRSLLMKSSKRNVFMLLDDAASPVQTISAARHFVDRFR